MLSPVDKLLAIEEIKQLKARYVRFVDSQDWENWRNLFTEDVIFGPLEPLPQTPAEWTGWGSEMIWDTPRIVGRDAIVEWISKSMVEVRSVHMAFMPEIEILSADEARGIWGLEDILRFPNRYVKGYGYYREAYTRQDGVWKIKHFHVLRKSLEYQDFAAVARAIV
jgi:hypothetical protein